MCIPVLACFKPQAKPAQLLRPAPIPQEPLHAPAGQAASGAAPVQQDDSSKEEDSEDEESEGEEEVAVASL